MPIQVPAGVTLNMSGSVMTVENSGKKLQHSIPEGIQVKIEDSQIIVTRADESERCRSLHGLTRTLINNMVIGVKEGFTKNLEMVGRGKRGKIQGKTLTLELGFSHPVDFPVPEGIEIQVEKNSLRVSGINKQQVGEVAAEIRSIQPPEPYKGAGIRYANERVRKKAGKSAIGGGFTGAGK